MRQRVEIRIEHRAGAVFDVVARDHWRNHPRWDPHVIEIIPLEPGPIGQGSRAHVHRKGRSGDGLLEVLEFRPDTRWVSRNQIGPFTLEMTALIEPAAKDASRLTLIADTQARGVVRHLLPLLGPVFRRQMRASLRRIKEITETESPTA